MADFSELCNNLVLTQRLLSSWNPQSNTILERIHQVLADCLRSFSFNEQTTNEMDKDIFKEFLAAVSFSIQCIYYQKHSHWLSQLVFGRDMFMLVDAENDWEKIQYRKQLEI